MYRIIFILTIVLLGIDVSKINAQEKKNISLSVETAVDIAIKNNPELKILRKNIKAFQAVKLQQGLLSNPELEIEAGNIFGTKNYKGFDGSEITFSLSQNIMLAGKISKREKVAEMDIVLAEWDYEEKRVELLTEIRKTFTNALSLQQLVYKNKELLEISEKLIADLKKRVKAGKVSPVEISRSKIIKNSLQTEIRKIEALYQDVVTELASLINDPNFVIQSLKGKLNTGVILPDYSSLISKLENNPKLKRFSSEYNKQESVIVYEEAKATPDLTISMGIKNLAEAKANAFVLGASMPLPLFDKNQGSILEAKIRLDQKKEEFQNVKNKLTLRLNLLFNRLVTLLKVEEKFNNETIPEAKKVFAEIKKGNMAGLFTSLDVLDAQRTLFEIQNDYLINKKDIQMTLAEIEGLTVSKIK
ncbi:MAG: TolC family protein [Rhodothermaceae bacterium]